MVAMLLQCVPLHLHAMTLMLDELKGPPLSCMHLFGVELIGSVFGACVSWSEREGVGERMCVVEKG